MDLHHISTRGAVIVHDSQQQTWDQRTAVLPHSYCHKDLWGATWRSLSFSLLCLWYQEVFRALARALFGTMEEQRIGKEKQD